MPKMIISARGSKPRFSTFGRGAANASISAIWAPSLSRGGIKSSRKPSLWQKGFVMCWSGFIVQFNKQLGSPKSGQERKTANNAEIFSVFSVVVFDPKRACVPEGHMTAHLSQALRARLRSIVPPGRDQNINTGNPEPMMTGAKQIRIFASTCRRWTHRLLDGEI
jgi:hypothetical protein